MQFVRLTVVLGSIVLLAVMLLAIPSFADGSDSASVLRETVILIQGMMCASCGQEVAGALKKLDGVGEVRVDVKGDRAVVSYDDRKVTPRQMVDAVRKAGFEAKLPEPGR